MIKGSQGVISIPIEKIGEYLTRLIKYYETNNLTNISKWMYDNYINGISKLQLHV